MKKRLVSLLACGVLTASAVAGLTACGSGDEIKLTVWGTKAQQETFKEMVEEFKQANPDKKYNIEVGVAEEDMILDKFVDPSAAADVFCYSNDQLIPLLRKGALARIGGTYLETIKANNTEESVASGSVLWGTENEKVYGYPYASDNGYFMYYDKSVVTDNDAKTVEDIISKCEAAGKKIAWALDVPWYISGWFFAFGGTYSVNYDYDNNYKEIGLEVSLNKDGGGVKAAKAMEKVIKSSAFAGKGTKDSTITTGFTTHEIAVAVTGTWNAKDIQTALGDNYGVCKLPTVNDPVTGVPVQLSSFKGYKLMGVNASSKNVKEANNLALFLSGEDMQKERFDKHMVGPTNKAVAALPEVKNDKTFAALNAQNAFAKDQTSVPSGFWEPIKSVGTYIMDDLLCDTPTSGKITYEEKITAVENQIKNTITTTN